MGDFIVYPAIDLRQGRVVRLSQGDPDRETRYGSQPLLVAQRWQQAGASWLHVVNLDGAFGEKGKENIGALLDILTTSMNVQFGGGLRNKESVRQVLDLGVERVVLGTIAVRNPALVADILHEFGQDRIALGIDALDGFVRVSGWREATPLPALDLATKWIDMGGKWLIFTDISRDGMGSGVNVDSTAALARSTGLNVIASGGVAAMSDIVRVREAALSGVIIGRALYEGQVDLSQALTLSNT
jgi:phosphoribosylformimino-5-aminoimidazole carboxamide ribotide isomerase